MSRDPRRLLKRPRHPRQWTQGARALVAVPVAVVAMVLVSAIGIALSEFPPGKPADPWAAEGAIFGIEAFVLAVLATIIATAAYINSTEKPSLQLTAEYPGSSDPLQISWVNGQPDASGQVTSTGERTGWALRLHLHNLGQVAARYVAVRVMFGAGVCLDPKGGLEWLRDWPASPERLARGGYPFTWQGGADAVVHPSKPNPSEPDKPQWPFEVPSLGPTLLVLTGLQSQTTFAFTVEVVADDVPPFKRQPGRARTGREGPAVSSASCRPGPASWPGAAPRRTPAPGAGQRDPLRQRVQLPSAAKELGPPHVRSWRPAMTSATGRPAGVETAKFLS